MKKISKQDAARRQLETAIELYFCDGDLLSVFILANNAFKITEDLQLRRSSNTADLKHDQYGDTFLGAMRSSLSKEEFSSINTEMGKLAGYLKHADRENDVIPEPREEKVLALLFFAIQNYMIVFQETTPALYYTRIYFVYRFNKDRKEEKLVLDDETLKYASRVEDYINDFSLPKLKEAIVAEIYKNKGIDARATTIGRLCA
jgi:hypothetical protein